MKRTTLLLLITALIVLGGLTACERPAPGSVAPAATATTALAPQATIQLPPVGASPTPLPIVPIDPNAPIVASPTPTIDPAAQPVIEPTQPAQSVAPEPTAAPPQETSPTGEIIHTVVAGDNLFRIGLRYGFTAEELAAYNGIPDPDRISIGQQIRIPPK